MGSLAISGDASAEYSLNAGSYIKLPTPLSGGTNDVGVRLTTSTSAGGSVTAMLSIADKTVNCVATTRSDITKPVAKISFPPPVSLTEGDSVTVRGYAADNDKVAKVTVNGKAATFTKIGAEIVWEASVPLELKKQKLEVTVTDVSGNSDVATPEVYITRAENLKGAFPDTDAQFPNIFSIGYDVKRQAILVGDDYESRIFAVDLNTGKRKILADNQNVTDDKLLLQYPSGFLLDESGDSLFVSDEGVDSIYKINMQTGVRTIVSQQTAENSIYPLDNPTRMIVDPKNSSSLVVADAFGLMAVNVDTGLRKVVSSHLLSRGPVPDTNVRFGEARDMLYWEKNNLYLVPNSKVIISVDPYVGTRTIFSDNQDKFGVPLVDAKHMAMDAQRGRFIINDYNFSAGIELNNSVLLSMDPETGQRTILADANTPNSFNALQYSTGFYYDGKSDYALIADGRRDAVIAVDVINGQRVIISKSAN